MSTDTGNQVKPARQVSQGISWERLIQDAESEIERGKARIVALQKSVRFFKKQATEGRAFPQTK